MPLIPDSEKIKLYNPIIEKIENKINSIKDKTSVYKFVVTELHKLPHFDWTGIYLYDNEDEMLNLAFFLGKDTDHIRIPKGKGVCGTAVAENRNIIVDDVLSEGNYLACSIETRSEIVVLLKDKDKKILGQIDVDSDKIKAYNEIDTEKLETIANIITKRIAEL